MDLNFQQLFLALNLAENNEDTPIMAAAQNGHLECVNALIIAGADVNHVDNDGDTPTILATRNGHHECLNVLITAGAHVD